MIHESSAMLKLFFSILLITYVNSFMNSVIKYNSRSQKLLDEEFITKIPQSRQFIYQECSNKQLYSNDGFYDPNAIVKKSVFHKYFRSKVYNDDVMTKKQFMEFPTVSKLLEDGSISMRDVDDMWYSTANNSAGLDEDEAYEVLSMVVDLPDVEQIEFLDKEFANLTKQKSSRNIFGVIKSFIFPIKREIDFTTFVNWRQLTDMTDGYKPLKLSELTDIYENIAKDINNKIDRKQFGKINAIINDRISDIDNNRSEDHDLHAIVNYVWRDKFDVESYFDHSDIESMESFYRHNFELDCDGLTFKNAISYDNIKELLDRNVITMKDIKQVWYHAVYGQNEREMGSGVTETDTGLISYDDFLRFNAALDIFEDEAYSLYDDDEDADEDANEDDNYDDDDDDDDEDYDEDDELEEEKDDLDGNNEQINDKSAPKDNKENHVNKEKHVSEEKTANVA